MKSAIQWTDATWNPVRGCSRVSAGCENCYAERQAHRFSGTGQPYEGLTRMASNGPIWTGKIRLVPEALEQPLRWKRPRRIFVNSMSDLFHEDVPRDFLNAVFQAMARTPQHTYQILTKRPKRMREHIEPTNWTLPNVWLGVSCEDQATADERIPLLLQTPAAVRFVSLEPLLGSIDLRGGYPGRTGEDWLIPTCCRYNRGHRDDGSDSCNTPPCRGTRVDWVIVGGESGPGARGCEIDWIRSILAQAKVAKIPAFVKQLGAKPHGVLNGVSIPLDHLRDHKGGSPEEWPGDLHVREFPGTPATN